MDPNTRRSRRKGFYGEENRLALSREASSSSSVEYEQQDQEDSKPTNRAASHNHRVRACGSVSSELSLPQRNRPNPSNPGYTQEPARDHYQSCRARLRSHRLNPQIGPIYGSGAQTLQSQFPPLASGLQPFPQYPEARPGDLSFGYPPERRSALQSPFDFRPALRLQTQHRPAVARHNRQYSSPLSPTSSSSLARRRQQRPRLPQRSERNSPQEAHVIDFQEELEDLDLSSPLDLPSPVVVTYASRDSHLKTSAVTPEAPGYSTSALQLAPKGVLPQPLCIQSACPRVFPALELDQPGESKNPQVECPTGGPTHQHRRKHPTIAHSSPGSPYPAYRFHTEKGHYNPLSFAPIDRTGNRSTSTSVDQSAELSTKGKSRKASGRAGTFSLARVLRRRSSGSPQKVSSSEGKRSHIIKKTSSSLAASVKKLFQSSSRIGSRKNSYEHTEEVFIDTADVFASPCLGSPKASAETDIQLSDSSVTFQGSYLEHHINQITPQRLRCSFPCFQGRLLSPTLLEFSPGVESPLSQPVRQYRSPELVTKASRSKPALPEFHFPARDPNPIGIAFRVGRSRPVLPEFHFPARDHQTEFESLESVPVPAVKVSSPKKNIPIAAEECCIAQDQSRSLRGEVLEPVSPFRHFTFPASNMDPPRVSRFLDPSSAMATITKQKAEAIRLAKEQYTAVKEMCRRGKTEIPPYEFEELIGKGAYGRVYKSRQLPSRNVVAIKVMEIDSVDYKTVRDMKDESIKDFIHEIRVLNQAKEYGTRNINMLIEAIAIHSQLWVVCEHCPGGSVKTLMRATGDRLEERFIIPIARELAEGLRAVHDAGIIHRDVKAANILIHEEGRLQICDFGVAGILNHKLDKRSTWVGTPHWMAPEMFSGEDVKYGSELDVWAYGCTLFEFATGNPPNAGLRERMQIGRQLNRFTPKLDGEDYGDELRDLVSFVLNPDPEERPSMATVLTHPYIANSAERYPPSSLSELVRIYYQWAQRGGQRISLFHPGGAVGAEIPGAVDSLDEDWNFSTTDNFERRFSILDLDQLSASLAEIEGEQTPTTAKPMEDDMTFMEKANFDERVKRGAAAMEGLFNDELPTYKYETKNDFVPLEDKQPRSDLPLRTVTDRSSVASTFVDLNLGSFESVHYAAGSATSQPFQLADADTIRANRSSLRSHRNSNEDRSRFSDSEPQDSAPFQPSGPRPPTMDWKFPSMMQPSINIEAESTAPQEIQTETEKRATRDWKFPVMTADVAESQGVNRSDADLGPAHTIRPPYQYQSNASYSHGANNASFDSVIESRPSTATSMVSTTSDYDPFRFDRPPTPTRGFNNVLPNLAESAEYPEFGSSILDGPGPDHEDAQPGWQEKDSFVPPSSSRPDMVLSPASPTTVMQSTAPASQPVAAPHQRVSNLRPNGAIFTFPELEPPSAESLMAGADDSVVAGELDRLLGDLMEALNVTSEVVRATTIRMRAPRERTDVPDSTENPPET